VKGGDEIADVLRSSGAFPDLFVDMAAVAESSGNLPEVLKGLAEHYENLIRLRNSFWNSILWPLFQLFAAIFIIAGAIYVMGIVGNFNKSQGNEPIDMLGLGLKGETGALIWLGSCFGTIFAIYIVVQLARHGVQTARVFDQFLLRIPVVGQCMRDFAIARFAWAFYLTQQTGMPVTRSLDASFRATGNGAYAAAGPIAVDAVNQGEDLSAALHATRLFPEEFLHMVMVAEESGTVPEQLHRMSPEFEEQARRSLNNLAQAASWFVWGCVAVMIITLIFTIFFKIAGMYNDALKQI
jgi:type IV pilus assembly protein PilC